MKIYTKTGDKGETGLVDGSRVAKSSLRIGLLGTLDESNAVIGLLAAKVSKYPELVEKLEKTQSWLFSIGSRVAEPTEESVLNIALPGVSVVAWYESDIDTMTKVLPPLKQFILPGGTESVALAHLARSVVRRAEREYVDLVNSNEFADPAIGIYLNRLSDWFFTIARYVAHLDSVPEVVWKPEK